MRALKRFAWPNRDNRSDPATLKAAEQLIDQYGEHAYETAGLLSWREDVGLLKTDKPGHWHRVRLVVGQRTGTGPEREFKLPSSIQELQLT